MNCDELRALLATGEVCEETPHGLRIVTDCLYPSFEPVSVYVTTFGDGFRITDGGGAATATFLHGRDEGAIQSGLKKACLRHSLACDNGMLIAEVPSREWLRAAMLAVANGAAMAASIAIEHVAGAHERVLNDKIFDELTKVVAPSTIAKGYEYRGSSGKLWHVDFAVVGAHPLLIKSVSPHHNSISSNYTVFGDIGVNDNVTRFSVHDQELKAEDAALMRQVAQLVPLIAVEPGARRALGVAAAR